jgi:hypothetical protein
VTPSFHFWACGRLTASFRELLLVEGIAQQGLGNWQAVAEHVGTRTREEVEEHYNTVYIDSPNWPRPVRIIFFIIPALLSFVDSESFSGWTYLLISIQWSSKNGSGGGYPT